MKIFISFQRKLSTTILIFFVSFITICAQKGYKNSPPEVINLFNKSQSYYSINDEIINGCVYPLPDSRIKGYPYLDDQWTEAILFVNNKKYTNLLIKYDLTIDDIILKTEIENGIQKLVNLNKFQIDSFLVGNSLFINSRIFPHEEKTHTYYEQIYRGKYSLFKKYEKVFIKKYNIITPYGNYSNLRTDIYLFDNKKLNIVNRKSLFIKCFENEKHNEIKYFMKKNNIKYRKASQIQLKGLMNYCSKLITL